MHIHGLKRAAAGAAALAAALLLAGAAPGPASAATGPATGTDPSQCAVAGSICVWEGALTGQWALYEDIGDACVTAPFGVLSTVNMTDRRVEFYRSGDCTGASAHSEPSLGLHSWKSVGPLYSFRAV
ncbi:hypothetical protein ACFVWY_26895 [Streptomyces sp. NPDC058195]|uniref:hypothetical protein n=1 Tax=Streptomyces sp. NPDC058195 TaxID=3346375 RepID=UPI0036E4B381